MPLKEQHRIHRSGWLRAAVLGANDGIVSTASLMVGVAAAALDDRAVILSGVAGLVGGAMSMAAGEYVSVKSQADTLDADLKLEAEALRDNHEYELEELATIYRQRGLDEELAAEVSRQLTAHDALGAHARDEIGITDELSAQPLQAAVSSGAAFGAGSAAILVVAVSTVGTDSILWILPLTAVLMLGLLGALAARAGGSSMRTGAGRVCFWGTLAMALTAGIGKLLGVVV